MEIIIIFQSLLAYRLSPLSISIRQSRSATIFFSLVTFQLSSSSPSAIAISHQPSAISHQLSTSVLVSSVFSQFARIESVSAFTPQALPRGVMIGFPSKLV
jgi:hypothetical protein